MAPPEIDADNASDPQRRRFWWLKWVLGAILVAILVTEGVYLWPTLHESWIALREVHWGWVAAAIAAIAVSMSGFGRVQKSLMAAAQVHVTQRRSDAVVYASTGMSLTLPAGQVFSTAFTFRQTRSWGASPVVASWQLAMSGVIATASLGVLGVGGALAVGTSVSPFTLIFSVGGVIALLVGGRYIANNPESLEGIGRWVLRWINKVRDRSATAGLERFQEILAQLESVQLRKRNAMITFVASAVHRSADVACLGFACLAVGAHPSLGGLAIAFAAAKAVGSIPLAPGGLVFVDATLIATLTAAGTSGSQALSAVFVYRLISFVLVAVVGWIVFLILFKTSRQANGDPHEGDQITTGRDGTDHRTEVSVEDPSPDTERLVRGTHDATGSHRLDLRRPDWVREARQRRMAPDQ